MLKTNVLSAFCLFFTLPMTKAAAQIIPDDTLGTEKSIITPVDELNDKIEGGASRGSNLFHSFSEFNVGEGRGVDFVNPAGIENILTRVTGNNVSNIFGRLGVLGQANLFLINPNGIIFGDGARLDMAGSFYGSTAESILFPDRVEFSATNPEKTLLTIDRPLGLYLGNHPGSIDNRSVANRGNGLEVSPGETLSLVGGEIKFTAGKITAPGSKIELGGLSAAGIVTITENGSLSFPKDVAKADITLTNGAEVDVRSVGGGSITVNARDFNLLGGELGGSSLSAGIGRNIDLGKVRKAGDIVLNATDTITVSQGSGIFNQVEAGGLGNAGNITITTDNLFLREGSQIDARTFGRGNGGDINLNATSTISASQSLGDKTSGIFNRLERTGIGNAGNITITTSNLLLTEGGQIDASTYGRGNGGTIDINTTDNIKVRGLSRDGDRSRIVTTIGDWYKAEGIGGDINIGTANLFVEEGGRINASTFRKGDAGKITITASDTILVQGESGDRRSGIFSQVGKKAVGNGNSIEITTDKLSLIEGGRINASTEGQGDAGKITITAHSTISVRGESKNGSSDISSQVRDKAVGKGGSIEITTANLSVTERGRINASTQGKGIAGSLIINADRLTVQNQGELSVNSRGNFNSGNIEIDAETINLDNRSKIIAETESGNEGNITLSDISLLTLRRGSTISTNAIADGSGGNIKLDASNGFVVALPEENSDITANAFSSNGGNININAVGIFGIEELNREELIELLGTKEPDVLDPNLSESSDITALSQTSSNLNGQINLNTLEIEPSRQLFTLPTQPLNTQIAQTCTPGTKEARSEFIFTGRGGIAPHTLEALQLNPINPNWVELDSDNQNSAQLDSASVSQPSPTTQIVEAQGWIKDENGEIVLVADPSTVTPHDSWQKLQQCDRASKN